MRWYSSIFIICIFFIVFPAKAAKTEIQLEKIRYGVTAGKTRIVFDLNGPADFRAFLLEDPYRVVVDLPSVKIKTYQSQHVLNNIIQGYRSGFLDGGITRIIFDLKKPALVDRIFSLPKDSYHKDRIVLDLKPTSSNRFMGQKKNILGNPDLKVAGGSKKRSLSAYRTAQNDQVKKAHVQEVQKKWTPVPVRKPQKKYTIVIDAGHGGGDPGATGYGIKEKDVALACAKELERQMEETGRYNVVLTRNKDVYVKLRERVDMSRRRQADLFVSLHADKIERKNVEGTAIYTLSERASDKETERLAEGENNAGFVAGVDLTQESSDVADILLDLAMREKMNESNLLARMIKHSLMEKKVKLLPNSHRSAGFAVLKAPDIPSILIETGFLSNKKEAKRLNSSWFQRKIASAILNGVDGYFRKINSLQKP